MQPWVIRDVEAAHTKLLDRSVRGENTPRIEGEKCLLWQGAKTSGGYGKISIEGRLWDTHRLSYRLSRGEMPSDQVCHTCDTPACVEPAHLWGGTQTDNMSDCAAKGRNGSQRHPESRPRGDDHWTHKLPGNMPTAGENNPHAKLTEDKVRRLREVYGRGEETAGLAREFGVSPASAWAAASGKTWKHVK